MAAVAAHPAGCLDAGCLDVWQGPCFGVEIALVERGIKQRFLDAPPLAQREHLRRALEGDGGVVELGDQATPGGGGGRRR